MLKQLYIKNFALIDELDVDFHKGFSVITGETGAGKSIIIGALGLLLGNRADIKTIKEGEKRCIIEAQFDIEDYDLNTFFDENDIERIENECILRREINSNGKSRAFINDSPVALQLMKELGEHLIDIHSQHQNLLIQKDNFQMSVVDTIAKNQALLTSYKELYSSYNKAERKLEETKAAIEANKQNADFLRYQYEEISKLQLKSGEEEALDRQSNTMQHSEDIKSALFDTDTSLGDEETGILIRLHHCIASIRNIAPFYPQSEEIINRLDSAYVELKDLSADVADQLSGIEYDPDEMERVNNRLDSIYSLEHKHHVDSVNDLIELEKKFKEDLDNIDNSEMTLKDLEDAVAKLKKEAKQLSDRLTEQRKKAIKDIEKEMSTRLKPLGLPNVRFKVELSPKDMTIDGADKIEFLFSANPGTPLRPVSDIASGGEIARVMLSLKAMLSGAINLPTIIFDEIDTGVSGRVAEQMAVIMKQMGQAERQVISITHLPQIAAMGSNHYKVYKEQQANETKTHMTHLSSDQRITEIAQMLSGSNVSEAAINNAKELLGL
jgi:DNA repair protein RecN (Recombination protein N)